MAPKCVAWGSAAGEGVSLHGFPKNEADRQQWLGNVNLLQFPVANSAKLCSKHFNEKLLICEGSKSTLAPGAFPTIIVERTNNPHKPKNANKKKGRRDQQAVETANVKFDANVANVDRSHASVASPTQDTPTRKAAEISFIRSDHHYVKSPGRKARKKTVRKQTEQDKCQSTSERVDNHPEEKIVEESYFLDMTEKLTRYKMDRRPPLSKRLPSASPAQDLAATTSSKGTNSTPTSESSRPKLVARRRLLESSPMNTPSSSMPVSSPSPLKGAPLKRIVYNEHHYYHSPETPRTLKRKLKEKDKQIEVSRKKLRGVRQKLGRLRKQVRHMQDITDDLQKKLLISSGAADVLRNEFDGPVLALLTRTMKNRKSKDSEGNMKLTREKYPPDLRSFALTLNFYSTKAYNYVRETFDLALPHVSVIRSWYAEVDGDPGYNEEAFKALKMKVAERKAKGKKVLVSLMFDEMSIKNFVEHDGKEWHGYVDVGAKSPDTHKEEAAYALVFMAVALDENWKIPIAYFFVNGVTASEKANLVTESLTRLHSIEVDVASVTFDGTSANTSMCNLLGANMSLQNPAPWFSHPCDPGKKVFLILDPCHMIKLIRNNWCALKILKNGKGEEISWFYIDELHTFQEKEGVLAGNKLNRQHMEWRKKDMKVKLAVQVLSRSVADALEFLNNDLKVPQFRGCEATVQFIRHVNDLFDILNSRSPYGKGTKAPLKKSNEKFWRKVTEEAMTELKNLTDIKGAPIHLSAKKTGFVGMYLNAVVFQCLFDLYVKGDSPLLNYILGYKFSQDHLELFFCAVRSKGGWCNNPTARLFKITFKRLLHHIQIKATNGNVEAMDSTTILHVTPKSVRNQKCNITLSTICTVRASELFCDEEVSYVGNAFSEEEFLAFPETETLSFHLSSFLDNVTAYRAGYVVGMVQKRLKCVECLAALHASDTSDPRLKLLLRKNRGGLCIPSSGVINICLKVEKVFRLTVKLNPDMPALDKNFPLHVVNTVLQDLGTQAGNLFPDLSDHQLDSKVEDDHLYSLIKCIANCFTRCRMFQHGKMARDQSAKHVNVRQKLTRTIINFHL